MANRRRRSFIGLIAIGALLGAAFGVFLFRAWPSGRSALQPYDSGWGARMSIIDGAASVSINFINEPTLIDGGPRFTYWTGGFSRGKQPVSPPTRVVASARQGLVQVEVKAEGQAPSHAAVAAAVARHIKAATTVFWPREKIPVAVELHQVPPNSRYEFARKITWQEDRPFHLTLFINETDEAQKQAGTAVHELYHVLTTRWRLGSKSEQGIAAPWRGSLYEEITASLLAECSQLQVTRRLTFPEADSTFTLHWGDGSSSTYKDSFDARGLGYMLDPANAEKFKFSPGLVNDLLRRTALLALRPGGDAIVAGSDSAQQVMALCQKATSDPWYLEGWFRGLPAIENTSR